MSEEQNQPQRESWATPEQINEGRAIVLERLERVRKWLADSQPSVLEERLQAEWRTKIGPGVYRRFSADQWREAKDAHEFHVRRFAELVVAGDLFVETVRGILRGQPFDARDLHEDDDIPF